MTIDDNRSLREAINEMCKSCIYDRHHQGGWRQQVEGCVSAHCPLFDKRPTPRERVKEQVEEIKKDALHDPETIPMKKRTASWPVRVRQDS